MDDSDDDALDRCCMNANAGKSCNTKEGEAEMEEFVRACTCHTAHVKTHNEAQVATHLGVLGSIQVLVHPCDAVDA